MLSRNIIIEVATTDLWGGLPDDKFNDESDEEYRIMMVMEERSAVIDDIAVGIDECWSLTMVQKLTSFEYYTWRTELIDHEKKQKRRIVKSTTTETENNFKLNLN